MGGSSREGGGGETSGGIWARERGNSAHIPGEQRMKYVEENKVSQGNASYLTGGGPVKSIFGLKTWLRWLAIRQPRAIEIMNWIWLEIVIW